MVENFTANSHGRPYEVRETDPITGGQKGVKLERYEFLPVQPLREVARVYGYGASKYADRNWERGYNWSWSYGALQRHLNAFWGGESTDSESGLPHLAHAIFHCLALMEFERTHPEKDDRSKGNNDNDKEIRSTSNVDNVVSSTHGLPLGAVTWSTTRGITNVRASENFR